MSLFVKKGDTVVVLSGEDKGKKGKVLSVLPKANKVIVEGINIISRHKKPRSAQDQGGIIKKEAAIYADKVQVICPVCEKPTRVGFSIAADGKKTRVCKHDGCGKSLDDLKEAKAEKKAAKKTAAKADAAEKKVASKKTVAKKAEATDVVVTAEAVETAATAPVKKAPAKKAPAKKAAATEAGEAAPKAPTKKTAKAKSEDKAE